jgi:wobble nucleotide-excising tRNase
MEKSWNWVATNGVNCRIFSQTTFLKYEYLGIYHRVISITIHRVGYSLLLQTVMRRIITHYFESMFKKPSRTPFTVTQTFQNKSNGIE